MHLRNSAIEIAGTFWVITLPPCRPHTLCLEAKSREFCAMLWLFWPYPDHLRIRDTERETVAECRAKLATTLIVEPQ
jgi:hypothetical protein